MECPSPIIILLIHNPGNNYLPRFQGNRKSKTIEIEVRE